MSYLEDVLAATERTKARNAKAKVGTSALIANAQAMIIAKQMAEAAKIREANATPAAPSASPVAAPAGGRHSMNDGHGHSSAAEVRGLNKQLDAALKQMIKDSGGKIKINSGYRSVERQTQLWNAALKKYGSVAAARKWVAPPGKSNHNHGLAADLGYADAATRQWAHANAAKYGLAFPLSNEPWHIELRGARR